MTDGEESIATVAERSSFRWPDWETQAADLADEFRRQQPFPHLRLSGFLEPEAARRLALEFPPPTDDHWVHYKHYNENTLGKSSLEQFPPATRQLVQELSTPRFTAWLSTITGIPGLLADPELDGGGLHQTRRGGFLNIHADFSHHHRRQRWRRRCNLILYLNDPWQDSWGGALEFWDSDMQKCVVKYPPRLNDAVIFTTDRLSYHGYPEPLTCPIDVARKSLALYYYTEESAANRSRSTTYRARPHDGARRGLIWLDTQLVRAYSLMKARFGWSDRLASRLLRWWNGK